MLGGGSGWIRLAASQVRTLKINKKRNILFLRNEICIQHHSMKAKIKIEAISENKVSKKAKESICRGVYIF